MTHEIPLFDQSPDGKTSTMSMAELESRVKRQIIASDIRRKFEDSQTHRSVLEDIWLECYWAYRGQYSPEELVRIGEAQARNPGSSTAYIPITKTKILAAHGQILEILFGSSRNFPITVEPTPMPEGIAESAYITKSKATPEAPAPEVPKDIYGYAGDGKELAPGTTSKTLRGLASKFLPFIGKGTELKEGISPNPAEDVQIHPAKEASEKLQKVMLDQLAEDKAVPKMMDAVLDACIYGTGFMKGPTNLIETIHIWEQDPDTKISTYSPKKKLIPHFNDVSIWNLYFEPGARDVTESSWAIERHLLSSSQLKALKRLSKADLGAINRILETVPTTTGLAWETQITDVKLANNNRYEVLEYWGVIDRDMAQSLGLDVAEYDEIIDTVNVNIWVCRDEVLRAVINPFTPQILPYYPVLYEKKPGSIYGRGIAENARDTQKIMNGHIRMAIDNLRLSGSVMFEINERNFAPGQDPTMHPGKIFRTLGNAQGQSIYSLNVNNTTQQHLAMYDKARQLADEATGMPSYAYGQTGVTGTGRTASGISMLMGAAAGTIKTVMHNIDEFCLEPMGQGLFRWNMQFNDTNIDIRGDYKIVAGGTSALMQKEVLTQRYTQLLQVVSGNPVLLAMTNLEFLLEEIAKSMGLDKDKLVNDPDTAKLYAMLIGQTNGTNPQQGNPNQAPGVSAPGGTPSNQPPSGGIQGQDPTGAGGGTIGTGVAPTPGEAGFSG